MTTATTRVHDPVCGQTLDAQQTRYVLTRQGVKYYFCSADCMTAFITGRASQVPQPTASEPPIAAPSLTTSATPTVWTVPIRGMHCASCVYNVENALKDVPGVVRVEVSLPTHLARIEVTDSVPTAALVAAVRRRGYDVGTAEWRMHLEGLVDASGVERIERALYACPGVVRVHVDMAAGDIVLEVIPGIVRKDDLRAAITRTGYTATILETRLSPTAWIEREYRDYRRRLWIALGFTFPLMVLIVPGMVGWHIPLPTGWVNVLAMILAFPVQFWAGWPFLRGAWNVARRGSADMNTLVALSTLTAFTYSCAVTLWPGISRAAGVAPHTYFDTSAMIVTLILLGRTLETRARSRTGETLQKLLSIQPATARVQRDGRIEDVPVEQIRIDDRLIVRPGERIPVDGTVVDGFSTVDESAITGESVPVDKHPGDPVISGTLNLTGQLTIHATQVGEGTVLQRMIRLVERAQATKAPIQRLADRISAVFVPAVLSIAALTFVVWYLWGPEPRLNHALVSAIAVLIIACPCALGLATPTAVVVGIGRGATMGILIKNAETFEKAHRVDTVVLDKTGTLTQGQLAVHHIEPLGDRTDRDVLQWAAAVEQASEHPIARAIVAAAKSSGIPIPPVQAFHIEPGRGAFGTVHGHTVRVGAVDLLDDLGEGVPSAVHVRDRARALGSRGETPVIVIVDDQPVGIITVADTVRPEAAHVIRELHRMQIRTVMITGDIPATAHRIAAELGMDDVRSRVLPHEKAHVIAALQQDGHTVAMVGDGINDAPALVQADVGIAMGRGTDIAVEAGEIVLMRNDLRGIVQALCLARQTMRTIRQNLFFSFVYNVLAIPIAAGVLYPWLHLRLHPSIAAAAMAMSSVSVVTNSLRLRRRPLRDG